MPQTVDRIDFACVDVDPSQWPKLSCGGANQLGLEAGSLRLEANRELLFQDNGQLRSFDDNHRLVFNRAGNLLELHEAGDIRFLTGVPIPTEKLRIRADGNVGVGIASPSQALDVNGAVKATDFIKGTTSLVSSQWMDVAGGINYAGGWVGIGTTTPSGSLQIAGPHPNLFLVGNTTANEDGLRIHYNETAGIRAGVIDVKGASLRLRGESGAVGAGATERLFIDLTTGNVGIGTTSPLGTLDVRGFNMLTDANREFNSHFPWTDNSAYVTGQTIYLRGGAPQGWKTALTVDGASGNIGIGTTSPEAALDVWGAIRAGNSDLYFTKTDHIHTGIGNQTGYAAIENAADYDALMILGRAGTAKGRTVRLWDYLQINGDLDVTGKISGQLTGLNVAPTFQARVRCADFIIGGTPGRGPERRAMVAWENLLEINHNGDWPRVMIQNLASGSSQERKENIAQLTLKAAQQVLHLLNPVEFSVKTDPEHQIRSGFIAEESPSLVATNDHKAIFVDAIVAVLTKVVQQQCLEIVVLKSQLTALSEKMCSPQSLV